jgi:hypothetical protein
MGFPLELPLTLALSPQAGRGDPGGAETRGEFRVRLGGLTPSPSMIVARDALGGGDLLVFDGGLQNHSFR